MCGLSIFLFAVQGQDCESLFAGKLKDTCNAQMKKFRKKAKKVGKRQTKYPLTDSDVEVVIIPRVYYKKDIKETKRVNVKEYFCYVDPKSVTYYSAIMYTPDTCFLLMPSPLKKNKYNVFPASKLEVVKSLLSMIEEVHPEMIFTICNVENIFFIKNNRILVFDREKGKIMEQDETLLKVINDPLSFRYIPPGE